MTRSPSGAELALERHACRRRAAGAGAAAAWRARRCTSRSVARTLSPRRTTSPASAAGSARASSARAWPARQLALVEPAAHRRRQGQQPQRVGDMAAALADGLGEARLGAAELLASAGCRPRPPRAATDPRAAGSRPARSRAPRNRRARGRRPAPRASRRAAPRASAARRRPARRLGRPRRRPAAPEAAGGCPSRGSTARAPSSSASAKRRRGWNGAGRISSIGTARAARRRPARRAPPSSPNSAASPRPSCGRLARSLMPRPAARATPVAPQHLGREIGYRPARRRSAWS